MTSPDLRGGLPLPILESDQQKLLESPSVAPLVQARGLLSRLKIFLENQAGVVPENFRPAYLAAAGVVEEAMNRLDPIKLIEGTTQDPTNSFEKKPGHRLQRK